MPPEPTADVISDEGPLIQRVLAGDREAAERLFSRHFRPLYEFVHYRLGAPASEVEDVVQETLVVGFENLARFDGRSSLSTWLAGIARNKVRARRRKLKPMALADAIESAQGEVDAWLASIDERELPDHVLERKETRELVGAALALLSPDHREALVAKYVDGRSTAELAANTGRGVKAAESMLTRARLAFAGVFTLLAKRRGGLG